MENFVASLAEGQARAGHHVQVVTLDRIFDSHLGRLPSRERRNGVDIDRIGFLGSRRYPFAPGVLRHLADSDVVHVHGLEFFADYLGWTHWLHRKPLVLSTHGGFFHTGFARSLKRLWFSTISRATLRRYRAVLASSVQDAETFRAIAPRSVALVENAVDTDKFRDIAARDGTTMIYFGRLAPNKGLPALLGWFAKLHTACPEWRLIVAGKEMGVTLDELRAIASSNGIAEVVEFHASPSDAELAALIGRSRVYACASSYEGFGLAAVEAIAAGLYPLLSAIPVFHRTIDRVGIGTTIDFTGADIDTFLADFARFGIGDRLPPAVADALHTFGWPAVLDLIEQHYRDVLAAEPPPRLPRQRQGLNAVKAIGME